MTRRGKRRVTFPILLAALVVLASGCVKEKPQVNAQERNQVYAEMKAFAAEKLQLKEVPCGDLPTVTPDTPCYVTDLKAQQVRDLLDSETDLRRQTGWRNDYGVTGSTFAWRGTSWSFGIVYALANLEDYQERPDIRDHEGLVHIIIDTL